VATALTDRGHDVHHVRDVLRPDSPDQVIAYLAIQQDFVALTHDKDFRNINVLAPRGMKRRFRMADRIILGSTGVKAAIRVVEVHDLLVAMFEWSRANGRQFRVDITEISVRFVDRPTALMLGVQ
jgi:hypothetical protein